MTLYGMNMMSLRHYVVTQLIDLFSCQLSCQQHIGVKIRKNEIERKLFFEEN